MSKEEAKLIKEKEIKNEKKQNKVNHKETKKKGFSLGCLLGYHAYVNGKCIYCGKKL